MATPTALLNSTLGRRVGALPRRAYNATGRVKWKILSELFRLPAVRIDDVADEASQAADLILDDVCMPPFEGAAHDDLGAALRIAQTLRPRVICEIGTAHGNLTANLLRHCAGARIITVNAPRESQSGVLVTYALTEDEIGRVYRRHGYTDRVVQLMVNSLHLDLRPHVDEGGIDLAIVDGCHDTAFVLNDFDKVRPFVRSGGVVLLHDTHPSQHGHLAGSYRACVLLRKRGFDVKWIDETWWGYWTLQETQP